MKHKIKINKHVYPIRLFVSDNGIWISWIGGCFTDRISINNNKPQISQLMERKLNGIKNINAI